MNVQEELQSVLAEVRAKRWMPELFDRVRAQGYSTIAGKVNRVHFEERRCYDCVRASGE